MDLAGNPRPNLPTEIRVARGDSDFPCVDLEFDLRSNGRSVASSHDCVRDRNYLGTMDLRYSANDPLAYETIMLDNRFRNCFGVKSPAG